MKRSIGFMLAATVAMLFGLATSAPAQMVFHPLEKAAPAVKSPEINRALPTQGLTRIVSGEGRVYTPMSSIAVPGSAGVSAHTDIEVFIPNGFVPDQVSPPYSGWGFNTPSSIACVYKAQSGVRVNKCVVAETGLTNASGGSQTIAIVDAYDDPWIMDDLNTFSSQFDLPLVNASNFQVVYASGTEPPFDTKDDGGWELEESLDVEYAHAMAPNANIVLVESADNSLANLLPAVQVASNYVACGAATCTGPTTGTGEVILSWGTSEFAGETGDDANFNTTGVVYFSASGDEPGVSYPCASPNVVCVGATTFARMPANTPSSGSPYVAFAGQQQGSWELTGSGSSAYEPLPSYQSVLANTLSALNNGNSTTCPTLPASTYCVTAAGAPTGVGISTTNRVVPDISANGNPNSGYWVYDSFQFALLGYIPPASDAPDAGGWWIVGGTSAANTIVAGMANLGAGPWYTNGNLSTPIPGTGFKSSSAAELQYIYGNMSSAWPSVSAVNPRTGSTYYGDILAGYGVCGPYMGYTPNVGWDLCSGVGVPSTPDAF